MKVFTAGGISYHLLILQSVLKLVITKFAFLKTNLEEDPQHRFKVIHLKNLVLLGGFIHSDVNT